MRQHFELAIQNIASHGDTDVFPYPLENHIFYDRKTDVVKVLEEIHKNFAQARTDFPPTNVKSMSAVGYSGFRSATQLDPIWNAYLLALVLSIGPDIEKARIPIQQGTVFSYRFNPDTKNGYIFDLNVGWKEYQLRCVELARHHPFVLSCDISDFYPRIYHHRLENALKKATTNAVAVERIKSLLYDVSEGVSYGLPVGGPAARLLSELLLNRTDRLLATDQVVFCRFVDDFRIFAKSREQAYAYLVTLSEILQTNEGLSLQKTKTRIMTAEEFLASSTFAIENIPESKEQEEARAFIKLRLRYDPYSPSAVQDYETLRHELKKFDIVGMLAREIRKSRIDEALTRRLIGAIKHLAPGIRNTAVESLVENFSVLYPVFPTVMLLLKAVINDLDEKLRQKIFNTIRKLVHAGSYITLVPANLAFALRVLSHDNSVETESLLSGLYKTPVNMMIKRDIILIMAKRNGDYWISNCRQNYPVVTPWERRALLIASYILEDEGEHWRKAMKRKGLPPMDRIVMDWADNKKANGSWDIPL